MCYVCLDEAVVAVSIAFTAAAPWYKTWWKTICGKVKTQ
jgi:hypothetical protein